MEMLMDCHMHGQPRFVLYLPYDIKNIVYAIIIVYYNVLVYEILSREPLRNRFLSLRGEECDKNRDYVLS